MVAALRAQKQEKTTFRFFVWPQPHGNKAIEPQVSCQCCPELLAWTACGFADLAAMLTAAFSRFPTQK